MTEEPWLELPEDLVAKIEKVLGIPSAELAKYGLVKLIEDLCDTALMFDREDRGAPEAGDPGEPRPPTPPPSPGDAK